MLLPTVTMLVEMNSHHIQDINKQNRTTNHCTVKSTPSTGDGKVNVDDGIVTKPGDSTEVGGAALLPKGAISALLQEQR